MTSQSLLQPLSSSSWWPRPRRWSTPCWSRSSTGTGGCSCRGTRPCCTSTSSVRAPLASAAPSPQPGPRAPCAPRADASAGAAGRSGVQEDRAEGSWALGITGSQEVVGGLTAPPSRKPHHRGGAGRLPGHRAVPGAVHQVQERGQGPRGAAVAVPGGECPSTAQPALVPCEATSLPGDRPAPRRPRPVSRGQPPFPSSRKTASPRSALRTAPSRSCCCPGTPPPRPSLGRTRPRRPPARLPAPPPRMCTHLPGGRSPKVIWRIPAFLGRTLTGLWWACHPASCGPRAPLLRPLVFPWGHMPDALHLKPGTPSQHGATWRAGEPSLLPPQGPLLGPVSTLPPVPTSGQAPPGPATETCSPRAGRPQPVTSAAPVTPARASPSHPPVVTWACVLVGSARGTR